ncbi:hypothetical protein CRE_13034 [Caenorhabditis remanei]|uniref:Uncharacterized protein n=1 Tax=Caenorhabditis remanei TaxID=31234 RepID=E3N7E2_CAERE|nr:hypothetical protein CRE_13034 [Caenorhabditis remanei]
MNVTFLNDPYNYSICLYVLGITSLPIHVFGVYCILFQTPEAMKRVKWVMLNLHLWSCCLDNLLSILGQPFIVPPVFGGASLGLLHHWNVSPGVMVYCMVTLIELVSLSTSAIFENRFYILFAEKSLWRIARYPYCLMNIALAFLYFVPTMIGVPDQKVARDWIFKNYPQISHFNNFDIYLVSYETKARDQIGYRMIISTENDYVSQDFSGAFRFLRAINMQIAIPAAIISTPQVLMMVLGYLDYSSPEINSIGYMLMSIHVPLLSCCTVIHRIVSFVKVWSVED